MSRGPITTALTRGDTYKKGDWWMIDDISGEKIRQSEARKNWKGQWVHKENFEIKHPQLSVKGKKDKQSVKPVRVRPPIVFIGVNLLLQSETFDNASWTKNNATIVADSIKASDGQSTADSLVDDGTTSEHSVEQSAILTPQAKVSVSVEAKKGSQTWLLIKANETGDSSNRINVWFNLSDGSVGSATNSGTASGAVGKIERRTIMQGDDEIWYRCTVTGIPSTSGTATTAVFQSATGDLVTAYTGTSVAALFLWGASAKDGNPGNYLKTTTSTISNARVDL